MLGRSAKRRAVNSKSTPTLAAGLTRDESYELSLSLLNLEQFGQGGHSTFPAEGGALAAREKQLGRSRSEASTKLIHSLRWVAELERGGLGGGLERSIESSFVRSSSSSCGKGGRPMCPTAVLARAWWSTKRSATTQIQPAPAVSSSATSRACPQRLATARVVPSHRPCPTPRSPRHRGQSRTRPRPTR